MGFDLYCILCGCVNYNYFHFAKYQDIIKPHKDFPDIKDKFTEKDYKKYNKICDYLDNVLVLVKDGRILEGCDNDTQFSYFNCTNEDNTDDRAYFYRIYATNQEIFTDKDLTHNSEFAAKIIHKDCYDYIKKKFNKKLTYSDLSMIEKGYVSMFSEPNTTESSDLHPPLDLDYGIMSKYWSTQYGFLCKQIIADDNTYLLLSPLDKNVSSEKIKLIDNVYKQIMAKNNNIARTQTKKRLNKKLSKKLSKKSNRKNSKKNSRKKSRSSNKK